jgi:hypothetical protein
MDVIDTVKPTNISEDDILCLRGVHYISKYYLIHVYHLIFLLRASPGEIYKCLWWQNMIMLVLVFFVEELSLGNFVVATNGKNHPKALRNSRESSPRFPTVFKLKAFQSFPRLCPS